MSNQEQEKKQNSMSLMSIFRIVLIIALVILVAVLVKNYVFPTEVVKIGGLCTPTPFQMSAFTAFE